MICLLYILILLTIIKSSVLTNFGHEKTVRVYTSDMQVATDHELVVMITCVLCFRTMMTIFIFGVRGFISGAFQGFYVYTPEVIVI